MPRHRLPRPDIPLRVLVRDRSTSRMGVLISYGATAARVAYGQPIKEKFFWIKFYNLEQVPMAEVEEMRRKATENLV